MGRWSELSRSNELKIIQCIDKHWWCFFHFKHKELDKCPSKGFKEQSYLQRSTSSICCRDLYIIELCKLQKKAAEKQKREREQERGKIEAGGRQGRQGWMLHREGKVLIQDQEHTYQPGWCLLFKAIPWLSQRCKDSKSIPCSFILKRSAPRCIHNNQKLSQGFTREDHGSGADHRDHLNRTGKWLTAQFANIPEGEKKSRM